MRRASFARCAAIRHVPFTVQRSRPIVRMRNGRRPGGAAQRTGHRQHDGDSRSQYHELAFATRTIRKAIELRSACRAQDTPALWTPALLPRIRCAPLKRCELLSPEEVRVPYSHCWSVDLAVKGAQSSLIRRSSKLQRVKWIVYRETDLGSIETSVRGRLPDITQTPRYKGVEAHNRNPLAK
jgi:hypothetical protein